MSNSFMTRDEIENIGFKSIGGNVLLSKKASIYGAANMEIGSNVRIDDFCFLSGKIKLGNFIHIATGVYLYGSQEGITFEDFSGASPRTTIHADSDDYSGESLTNPMTLESYKTITHAPVLIKRHTIIGSGCVILPGVVLEEGSAIGAMSLVLKSTDPWTINAGVPCHKIKDRSRKMIGLEKQMMEQFRSGEIEK